MLCCLRKSSHYAWTNIDMIWSSITFYSEIAYVHLYICTDLPSLASNPLSLVQTHLANSILTNTRKVKLHDCRLDTSISSDSYFTATHIIAMENPSSFQKKFS